MKNFKPSELPVGTVIYENQHGHWSKSRFVDGRKIWIPETASVYNEDEYAISDIDADALLTNFTITALPIAVTEYILNEFVIHDDQVLTDAINYVREKPDEEL